MIKATVAHVFENYDVAVADGRRKAGDYDVDKTSWIPMADVKLEFSKRK
jgi:gliotoxin/aspirochlorine/mycotoxins biosynthesis cytochrome P450 monooxygenase